MTVILCDVGSVEEPDACVVDALARLQVIAKKSGWEIRLVRAGPQLRELLELMGLSCALPLYEELGIEPRGEAEQREHPRGVEEEADPSDLTL